LIRKDYQTGTWKFSYEGQTLENKFVPLSQDSESSLEPMGNDPILEVLDQGHQFMTPDKQEMSVSEWTVADVENWAKETLKLSDRAVTVIRDQEIMAKSFFGLSADKLESWGMPGGAAQAMENAIKQLTEAPVPASAPAGENEFWNRFMNTRIENRILSFPEGLNFEPFKSKKLKQIYVRESYERMWALMQDDMQQSANVHFYLTGNPGIGKSCFFFSILSTC